MISEPLDEAANTSGRQPRTSRRRAHRPKSQPKEQGRSNPSDWEDVDDSPLGRRRSKRRPSERRSGASRSSSSSHKGYEIAQDQAGRFFPNLSRILEVNESVTSSRPSTRGSDRRRHQDSSPTRRSRHKDDSVGNHRRPIKHRTGGIQRRSDSLLKINPSLLSVLSGLNGTSDRSSGSNSTVTQQSYDRRGGDSPRVSSSRTRRMASKSCSGKEQATSPNVFDYMEDEPLDDHDTRSVVSSTTSHYEPSNAGSSEAPGTPSSRSTFPSPTTNRSQSAADFRRKYDGHYGSASSIRSSSNSPDPSLRHTQRRPCVSDVLEDEEAGSIAPTAPSEISYDPRRPSSRSSRRSSRSSDRWQHQEDPMPEYAVYPEQGHYMEPAYDQHRSFSSSSGHSDRSAYGFHMAMQQYQWPTPPAPMPPPAAPQTMNGHIAPHERPQAPEAPDLRRRTLTGYEEIALQLSTTQSSVRPLYRRFEYLNHRILLHLQDELSELEERLRTLDEIIAQMDPAMVDGQKTPASRRGENYHGSEIHMQRTHLLGNIFVKTEQYNRAMSAYATMARDSTSADTGQISAYQQWMNKHAPIHEVETKFLQWTEDLIMPGKVATSLYTPTKHAALAYLPVALMLPLLLYSIIPTLIGRLVVTALIAVGAFIIAGTTRIRQLLSAREWGVCGAVYVLLMAAIAGCIPQHG